MRGGPALGDPQPAGLRTHTRIESSRMLPHMLGDNPSPRAASCGVDGPRPRHGLVGSVLFRGGAHPLSVRCDQYATARGMQHCETCPTH
jgi:hypothetical protein